MLQISEVSVDVVVVGSVASTRMEMVFANSANRVLEGELVFPLGEGQTVTGFEMEVNGDLRAGVVVPKARGRQIFEEIVREGIDPGLLEQVGSNAYRARVYPIPANGTKRIAITYEEVVVPGGNGKPVYQLPLSLKEVGKFELEIEVVQREHAPKLRDEDANKWQGLEFDRVRESWIADVSREDFSYEGVLSFELEATAGDSILVTNQKDYEGKHYGIATFSGLGPKEGKPQKYSKVEVYWDASASGSRRDVEAEIQFLLSYLEMVKAETVHLTTFHIAKEPTREFAADDSSLRETLEEIVYDGATQMGVLDLASSEADVILVFGDGVSTLGEAGEKEKSLRAPVNVITSAATAEHALLRQLADSSGGEFVQLVGVDPGKAADQLARKPVGELFVIGLGDLPKGVSEVVPGQISIVDGRISLGVAFEGKSAEIDIILGDRNGNEKRRLKASFESAKGVSGSSADGVVRRIFAQRKIAGLEAQWPATRKKIVKTGQRFGVVTRGTSLLVLDRIEDYVRFEIVPPESKLREEYHRLRKKHVEEEEKSRGQHLKEIAKGFKEFQTWYDGNYAWIDDTNLTLAELLKKQANATKLDKKLRAEADRMYQQAKSLKESLVEAKVGSRKYAELVSKSAELSDELTAFAREHLKELAISDVEEARGGGVSLNGLVDAFADPGGGPAPRSAPASGIAQSGGMRREATNSSRVVETESLSGGRRDLAGESKSEGRGSGVVAEGIQLAKWDPKSPYIKALKKAKPGKRWGVYAEQRAKHGDGPAFFLDVAEFFRKEEREDLSLRVLSNLAEMESENHALLRILGYRLLQLGNADLALTVFEEVLELRKEEPQSYRDLAAAHEALGNSQEAANLLWKVVRRSWDGRFPGIELIALHELNAVLDQAGKEVELDQLPKNLRRHLPVDIRAVMTWDADLTDIDLWVTGPDGEKCYYGHNRTRTGGRMSDDFTDGYGPEVFLLKRALPGTYRVQANYYGSHQQTLVGPATLQLELITNYGRPNEKRETITVRLESEKEIIEVGEFRFGAAKGKK